jgi:hypothetical protein
MKAVKNAGVLEIVKKNVGHVPGMVLLVFVD